MFQLMENFLNHPNNQTLAHYCFCYILNDLPNSSNVVNFYLFADDSNIYYESSSLQELEKTINRVK